MLFGTGVLGLWIQASLGLHIIAGRLGVQSWHFNVEDLDRTLALDHLQRECRGGADHVILVATAETVHCDLVLARWKQQRVSFSMISSASSPDEAT